MPEILLGEMEKLTNLEHSVKITPRMSEARLSEFFSQTNMVFAVDYKNNIVFFDKPSSLVAFKMEVEMWT